MAEASKSPFTADPDGDGVAEQYKWGRLVSTVLGVITGVAGLRLADLVYAIVQIPAAIVGSLIALVERLIDAIFGGPLAFVSVASARAAAFVESFGPLGFVVALALVVGTAYLAARARGVTS